MINGYSINSEPINAEAAEAAPPEEIDLRETATLRGDFWLSTMREFAALDDAVHQGVAHTVREVVAGFTEHTTQAVAQTVREAAVFNDAASDKAASRIRDTAVLNDAVSSFATARTSVREKAAFNDSATSTVTAADTARDTAIFNDAMTQGVPAERVRDTATFADALTTQITRRTTVREQGALNDRLGALFQTTRDTAVLDDAATSRLVARQTVRETAVLNDTLGVVATPFDRVREVSVVDAVAADYLVARSTTRERAFISADAVPFRTDTAWTANIQTWAMSRYDGFPFESLTERYAAGADGLFIPGADDFTASFTTGDCDFNTPQKKTLASLYAVGTHDEPLAVDVTADVRGVRTTASYTQMARDAASDRTVRSPVGRGFSSNFFRFTFASDAPFTVHSAEALVTPSTRRI